MEGVDLEAEMRLTRAKTEANGLVEAKRQNIGGGDPIKACEDAIEVVLPIVTKNHDLTEEQAMEVRKHLNQTFVQAHIDAKARVEGSPKKKGTE